MYSWGLLLLLLHALTSYPLSFGFTSGSLEFNELTQTKSTPVPHYNNPHITHSLSSIKVLKYFSYRSNYTNHVGSQFDTLSLTVQIGGVYVYQVTITYAFFEAMPNIELATLNLTYQKSLKVFTSKKGITFNEDTYIAAHLVGFSSSNLTKDNFFYASKFNTTYSVYSNTKMSPGDWVAIDFLILQSNYDNNNTICVGSYINSESEVSSKRSPMKIQVEPQLQFILGLEAIFLPGGDFAFNRTSNVVEMKTTGAYSFSIIVINTTCSYIYDFQYQESTKKEKIYLAVMIIFIVLFALLSGGLVVCCLIKRCFRGRLGSGSRESPQNISSVLKEGGKDTKAKKENSIRITQEEYIENIDIGVRGDDAPGTDVRLHSPCLQPQPSCPRCLNRLPHKDSPCSICFQDNQQGTEVLE